MTSKVGEYRATFSHLILLCVLCYPESTQKISIEDGEAMRIAVNGAYLTEPHTGTGRYLRQLLEAIGQVDGVNEYLILTQEPVEDRPATPSSFIWEDVRVSNPSERLRKVRWEQRAFPEAARRGNAKLLFVPHFAPPVVSSLPVITTIHDVIPFALPEYRSLSATWLYQQLVAQGARRATMVLTVSEHAKSEIIRYLGIPAERITVTQPAPAQTFRPVTEAARLRAVRTKYGLGERFIFYVGGFDVRKNVPLLVGAFAAVAQRVGDPSLKLLISGKTDALGSTPLFPDWRPLVRKFGLESRVVSAFVSDEDMPAVHSAALAFVYPSMYEGFGLPPVEAMACGAPVVVSDHGALQEVAGSAALSFPLHAPGESTAASTRALADQLTRLVTTPELREEYHYRALARAARFSWAQTAAETSSIFADLVGMQN